MSPLHQQQMQLQAQLDFQQILPLDFCLGFVTWMGQVSPTGSWLTMMLSNGNFKISHFITFTISSQMASLQYLMYGV